MASVNPIDVHIGTRVRAHRESVGLTAEALAKKSGISVEMLDEIESGGARADPLILFVLASTLGCSVTDFYEGFT